MFEFHVMNAGSLDGVKAELTKRTREGWELIAAYAEPKGGGGFSGSKHVLIFRKPL